MSKHDEIMSEIGKIKGGNSFSMQDVQTLAFCYGALQALNLEATTEQEELSDIFPALKDYQSNNSEHSFKNLCLEIQEFCQSVYVMTTNDEQRKIYFDMVKNLTTF